MPVWKLQVSWLSEGQLPRDKVVITPHFNDQGVGTDPQGLCEDLAAGLNGWMNAPGSREINVKAYDAEGTVPVFPQGDATVNAGMAPADGIPREVAICLSFYSERNRPRQRGRLYLWPQIMGAPLTARPGPTVRQKAADLVPIFTGLGGVDVDWCVYSKTDKTARPVTDWWVDDEWDVQRRRGLRPTTRLSGTTSEA